MEKGTSRTPTLLAITLSLVTLSTLLVTPSLPDIAATFHTDSGDVQTLVTIYLFSFAVCQLVFGALCDQIGRKPVLVAGLLLFTGASILCGFAPSLNFLIGGRAIQACGASASVVSVYAILRDANDASGFAKAGATMALVTGAIPGLAPIVGGVLGQWYGWRGNFFLLAFVALFLLVVATIASIETTHTKQRANLLDMIGSYASLLKKPRFLCQMLSIGSVVGGLYTYNAGIPFLLREISGGSTATAGVVTSLSVPSFLLGSLLGRLLLNRFTPEVLALLGVAICALGGVLFVTVMFTGYLTVPTTVMAFSLFAAGMGMSVPNIMASGLRHVSKNAGSGSALMGLAQTLGGTTYTFALSVALERAVTTLPILILIAGVAAMLAFSVSLMVSRVEDQVILGNN